jgi:hypothetical protein
MYTVRAEAKGFKTSEHSNFLLEVGKDIRVDLTLQPGEQTQTVVVTGETPVIETTNAILGGTLSNETINELPMMGRSYQNLLVLRPGMMIYPGGGGWTMSTNGSRPEENSFILEGLTNDNPLQGLTIINGPGVAGDAATIMPLDAIQEVNIQENPPADYGGKNGAFVNIGVKSGTNSLHGTAYAFGRDSAMDARNYFQPAPQPQRPVSLEQFGGTAGGPILRDKLFIFGGYEGERYEIGNFFPANVPEAVAQATPDPRNSLPDAINDLLSNGIQPSALSLKLTGCTVTPSVQCTGGLYPTNTGTSKTFAQGFPSIFGSDNGVLKVDYHINDKHTLSGTYFQSEGVITAEDAIYLQQQWRSVQDNRPRVLGEFALGKCCPIWLCTHEPGEFTDRFRRAPDHLWNLHGRHGRGGNADYSSRWIQPIGRQPWLALPVRSRHCISVCRLRFLFGGQARPKVRRGFSAQLRQPVPAGRSQRRD